MLRKIKNLFIVFLFIWFMGSCVFIKVKAEQEAAAKYKEENYIKPEDWQGPR